LGDSFGRIEANTPTLSFFLFFLFCGEFGKESSSPIPSCALLVASTQIIRNVENFQKKEKKKNSKQQSFLKGKK
jgi:hypothetical protein